MPASNLRIPAATQAQFVEFVTLIVGSESMNDEERQYWINILPAMTPAQRESLRDILLRERQQLQAIDRRYVAGSASVAPLTNKDVVEKRKERTAAEAKSEETEEIVASDILDEIDSAAS